MPGLTLADIVDPTASISESGEPNARLVPDARGEYTQVEWLGEERERINAYVRVILEEGREFYKPLYAKHAKNKAAYEGLGSKKQAIQLTISRAMLNQIHAWLMNRLFSKAPTLLSGRPLGDDSFEVIIPPERDPTGQPVGEAQIATVTSVDEADGAADMLNYRWLYRIGIRKLFDAWLREAEQSGVFPSILKMVANDGYVRTVTDNAITEATVELDGEKKKSQIVYDPQQRIVENGEPTTWKHVPGERFMIAPGSTSIDDAPWCAFFDEITKREIRRRIKSGKYNFGLPSGKRKPDDEATFQRLAGTALSLRSTRPPRDDESRAASRPTREAHGESESFDPKGKDTYYEVYVRWPILTPEEAKKKNPRIVETEIVLDYHLGMASQFCAWVLPWWSGRRMIADLYLEQRPGSYSGTSPGEDVAPYQRYMSQLFHLGVQSVVIQNQSCTFIDQDSPCWSELEKSGNRLRPGRAYKVNKAAEVKVLPLGAGSQGLNELITFLKTLASELGVYTQWDTGTASLTRVTSGAFAQQQTQVKMQPEYMYENICDAIGRLALMDMQGLIQFGPSQHVPPFAQKTKEVLGNLFHLPRKMVTDADFVFEVAATSDEETRAQALQEATQVAAEVAKENEQIIAALGQIMKPGMPPQMTEIALIIVKRSEECLGQILKHIRPDYENYIVTADLIRKMLVSLQQVHDQIGGGASDSPAEMAATGQLQPAAPAPPPPAPPAPPAPPPPTTKTTINYQLKGSVTPSQEAAIAAQGGFAGTPGEPPQPAPASPPQPGPEAAPAPAIPAKPPGGTNG